MEWKEVGSASFHYHPCLTGKEMQPRKINMGLTSKDIIAPPSRYGHHPYKSGKLTKKK